MPNGKNGQEREELHRAIWSIADDIRSKGVRLGNRLVIIESSAFSDLHYFSFFCSNALVSKRSVYHLEHFTPLEDARSKLARYNVCSNSRIKVCLGFRSSDQVVAAASL